MTTLNLQVGASTDDAHSEVDGDGYSDSVNTFQVYANEVTTDRYVGGARFDSVALDSGDTINTATLQLKLWSGIQDDPEMNIYGEDADDAATFSSGSKPKDRTKTTANVLWSAVGLGTGWKTSPDITTIIEEIIARGGWSSGNAQVILPWGRDMGSGVRWLSAYSYDWDSASAIKLDIDYTAGGGASIIPLAMRHNRQLRN